MKTVTIYHNPRCSKSRAALQLLQENNIEAIIVDYLKSPSTKKALKEIMAKLDVDPIELIRTNEAEFKALNVKKSDLSTQQIIDLIFENPKLLQRPIIINNKKAFIARPPERVLDVI